MKKIISCFISALLIVSFGTVFSSAVNGSENRVDVVGGYEFVRSGDIAYYPYEVNMRDNYENICKRLSGFDDGSTKIEFELYYESGTLDFVGAYPSYELKEFDGTVTVKSVGTLDESMDYACIEVDVDGFDSITNNMVLFNVKYNILQENFVSNNGIANSLSMIGDPSWIVTSGENSYNFGSNANFEDMIISDGVTYEILTQRFKDYKVYDPANCVEAESIALSSDRIKMHKNDSCQLTAVVTPEGCTESKIIWTSSDTSVAVVDSEGKVTAVGNGTTIITATIDGTDITSTCKVSIPYTPLELIKAIFSFLFGWLFNK